METTRIETTVKKSAQLIELAQKIAGKTPNFFETKGPGIGNKATNRFMEDLRISAKQTFGEDFSERKICGENNLAVDFYFPDEKTIIEVALSIHNPQSEFERDILKAIMAKHQGWGVDHLAFISKPGGEKLHEQASSKAIISWTEINQEIKISIHDLSDGVSS